MINNIIITGLAGQGVMSLAKILENFFIANNLDFRTSNSFGESQRGSSVSVHLRLGKVFSPIIPFDSAQLIIALEMMEGLREAHNYLSTKGIVLLNNYRQDSLEIHSGEFRYPPNKEIIQAILKLGKVVYQVEATDIALKLGNPVLVNMIILGMIFNLEFFSFKTKNAKEIIFQKKSLYQESNLNAFDLALNGKINKKIYV